MPKRRMRNSGNSLVMGYMERISSKIFSDFPKQLTDLIGRQHGVYALYKGSRLYYVGLATNLRGRIKQHLKDKHAGKWDKFSLYLVRQADHIKELEALIMRVASPAGNASRGRLAKADNLKTALEAAIKGEMDYRLGDLLGRKASRPMRKARSTKKEQRKRGAPSLSEYVKRPIRIKGTYKGKVYTAVVNKSGTIRFNHKVYNSPSLAGRAARGRNTNGWKFWHYRNKQGDWVRLDELRG